MPEDSFDVAVVGGGIVGLAHAWMARRRGLRVAVFERSRVAQGASVRNFGMIWPVGQPAGELYDTALRARELWRELGESNVVELEECGSLHLAHHDDELSVLEEFCELGTCPVSMLSAQETCQRSSLARPDGLLGALWSPTEMRVDPRTASARITAWLQQEQQVTCCFSTQISSVSDGLLTASDGRSWKADRIIICSNDDLVTLFPESLQTAGLVRCKLQMMKVNCPRSRGSDCAPHVAGGLTLRHYAAFAACSGLQRLKDRIAEETPELNEVGIHVMASLFPTGDVILGDSHVYGDDITPFSDEEIDRLILRELKKIIRLPNWDISERWSGIYARHQDHAVVEHEVQPNVHLFVGTGGAGMTMAFGLADRAWQKWNRESIHV